MVRWFAELAARFRNFPPPAEYNILYIYILYIYYIIFISFFFLYNLKSEDCMEIGRRGKVARPVLSTYPGKVYTKADFG